MSSFCVQRRRTATKNIIDEQKPAKCLVIGNTHEESDSQLFLRRIDAMDERVKNTKDTTFIDLLR
jgi:hypothetical protein